MFVAEVLFSESWVRLLPIIVRCGKHTFSIFVFDMFDMFTCQRMQKYIYHLLTFTGVGKSY